MDEDKVDRLADQLSEWFDWAEREHGEEYVYISGDLIPALAKFIVIMQEV